MNQSTHYHAALDVIEKSIDGLQALKPLLCDADFARAVDIMFHLRGRVIVSGMGKSGHIARKIAATMASTGTPAYFVHPAEASHGDLGMVSKDDCVVLLSNSGESAELGDIIHYCKRFSIPLIAVVRRSGSVLTKSADVAFILPEVAEASPVNAPTTSTTMMLAWGDALAMALLDMRGFKADDYKIFHPGGKLGSQLIKVHELMTVEQAIPVIKNHSSMADALQEISAKKLGCVVVVDSATSLPVGVVSDGDLRRHMREDFALLDIETVMTKSPIMVEEDALAAHALAIMNEKSITSLIVVSQNGGLVGLLHIHAMLRAGVS